MRQLRLWLATIARALPWLGAGTALLLVHLASPSVLESVDFVRFHSLNQEYLWNAIRSGRLPLWNPHVALGRPFLADVEAAFFYPPHWLGLLLGPRTAVCLLLAAHSALGLWAMTRLARAFGLGGRWALLPGMLFFTSGTIVQLVAAGQILYYAGVCYLPLVLVAALRLAEVASKRRIAELAAVLALQILATHPQLFWITCLAMVTLTLGRGLRRPWLPSARALARVLLGQAVAVALAVAVAAVQLLPFGELISQGNRQARTIEFASAWALPGRSLASLAFLVPSGNWSDNLYGGSLLALAGVAGLLALRGREARSLVILALLGGILALGTATPLFWLAFHLLPGLAFFRIPGRLGLLLLLALTLAAGLLLAGAEARRRSRLFVAMVTLAAAALSGVHPLGRDAVPVVLRTLALLTMGALIYMWPVVRAGDQRRRKLAVAVVIAAITVAEVGHGARVAKLMVAEPSQYPAEEEIHRALTVVGLAARDHVPPRVSIPYPLARENAGMRFGWSTFSGYVGLWLARTWNYVHTAAGLEVPTQFVAFPASNVYRGPFPYDGVSLVLGVDPATGQGQLRSRVDPRVYVAEAVVVVPNFRAAIEAMRRGHDYHRVALIEEAVDGVPSAVGAGGGEARIGSFAPERIEIDVQARGPGLLVLGESYYPGWSAVVNDREVPCVPVNGWMRGVPVPAGTSRVVLSYRSTLLLPGLCVSLLGLLLVGLLAWGQTKNRVPEAVGDLQP